MDNANLIIAANLKAIRFGKGWSQSFVASQLGMSQRTVSRAETGTVVSKRTLKLLCGLYQVPLASLYNESTPEQSVEMQVVPDEVVTRLLIKNSFISDLEREIILRYTNVIQKNAVLFREDIEAIIPQIISRKKNYSITDVIACGLAVNRLTLKKCSQYQ